MKVILTEEVPSLGKRGSVVNASDGYVRNYLFPRGLAVEANKANMNKLKKERAVEDDRVRRETEEARALAKRLKDTEVTLRVKAGDNGKLFGSVTSKDIADAIREQHGVDLDKRKIDLKDTIKTTGVFTMTVKLYQGIDADIKVRVEV